MGNILNFNHCSALEPTCVLLTFQLHLQLEQLAARTRFQAGFPSDCVEEFTLALAKNLPASSLAPPKMQMLSHVQLRNDSI